MATNADRLNTAIGRAIRKERLQQNKKQQEVATAANLDRAYLSSIENGKANVTLALLVRLLDALHMEVGQLMVDADLELAIEEQNNGHSDCAGDC